MHYYNDITQMRGDEADAVDVIIGGSPCQDLSVAGARAGLDGERSVLFLDQIRVIKEMHGKYGRSKPRYMVWENVPGALSSAGGEDFRRVLEETAKVSDETAVIPRPEKGKWTTAGAVVGDGYSIAWRILDAQFWGVPQRRRRIALVADFTGQSAPEILFKSESVSGYTAESGEAREGTAGGAESSTGSAICIQGNIVDRDANCNGRGWRNDDVSYTLNTVDRPAVYDARGNGNGEIVPTITGDHQNRITDYTAICCNIGEYNSMVEGAPPLIARMYKDPHAVCIPINTMVATRGGKLGRGTGFGVGNDNDPQFTISAAHSHAVFREGSFGDFIEGGFGTLRAQGGCLGGGSESFAVSQSTVRRLTPLECERLQGYPMVREVKVTEMTKDEYIAWNINEGNVVVDTEQGRIFATRGPGGAKLKEPKELLGTIVNGYKVVNIRNHETKMQCRVHRMVWIAKHGVIPEGHVIDHINNDKLDNRIENLQILTAEENSHKAKKDGAYLSKENNPSAKITNEVHDLIQYIYSNAEVSIRQLAEMFGISKSRVHQIIHDTGWTDIGEWTDGKGKKHKTTDSARYKALGNSIALPPWRYVCRKLSAMYDTPPTMGSLFDGIGGFPLIWREINGADSVPWACEIDEYCKAVTRRRLP